MSSDFPEIRRGDLDAVARRIKKDPKYVRSKDDLGCTPLHWTASQGPDTRSEHLRITELLIAHGADVNAVNNIGWPPIFHIATNGSDESIDVARCLIKHGARVDLLTKSGTTWWMLYQKGHGAKIEALLIAAEESSITQRIEAQKTTDRTDVIEYYHRHFPNDIRQVMACSPYDGRKLSLFCLTSSGLPENFDRCHQAFMRLENKVRFCFCLLFSTLLDQSIHAGLSEEHTVFDQHAQYPKIVGILGGAYSNMHPINLLAIPTRYAVEHGHEDADLDELAIFFRADYQDFLEKVLPNLPGRRSTNYDARQAVDRVFHTIREAVAQRHMGGPFVRDLTMPHSQLYDRWIRIVRRHFA